MVFRPSAQPKKRTSQLGSFPAPVGGWIKNRALSTPNSGAPGAEILENFFPTSTGAVLRRGAITYATMTDVALNVLSIFAYNNGSVDRLFSANDSEIMDITDSDTAHTVMSGFTSGNWSTVQFSTAGGIFLLGVNGEDEGFIYDGDSYYPIKQDGIHVFGIDDVTQEFVQGEIITGDSSWATATVWKSVDGELYVHSVSGTFKTVEPITGTRGGAAKKTTTSVVFIPGITFPSGSNIDVSSLSYVWNYKQRLYFVEKNSLNVWYLPVDQIGGSLSLMPLGGVMPRGGYLVFGETWSNDAGASGGLSEQCIFVSSEGEVAIYQGLSPSDVNSWAKVGLYRIGDPLGPRAWIRAGGEIIIATKIGLVPISQAVQKDVAALSPAAVSYPIEEAWNEAVLLRGGDDWVCSLWPDGQMMVVSTPPTAEEPPKIFASNARTGAWGLFTGWEAKCFCVFRGNLYFGTVSGKIMQAWVSGSDDGEIYVGKYLPLFSDMGVPGSLKIGGMVMHTLRVASEVNEQANFQLDYNIEMPTPPDASAASGLPVWDDATWDASKWSVSAPKAMQKKWIPAGGTGYTLSPALQITSGAVAPTDVEIIQSDVLFQVAAVMT